MASESTAPSSQTKPFLISKFVRDHIMLTLKVCQWEGTKMIQTSRLLLSI